MIVGVDEAGRGPLAGCVVACALCMKGKRAVFNQEGLPVKDSKKLSHIQREAAFESFREKTIFSLGIATHKEIDKYNILKATFIAFERALGGLFDKKRSLRKAKVIIDGNMFETNMPINYQCVVKADEKIREVAFASITAKLFRDYLMKVADFCFPKWELSKHKGYPTQEHITAIKKYGLSPLHRRSFAPCRLDKGVLTMNQKR